MSKSALKAVQSPDWTHFVTSQGYVIGGKYENSTYLDDDSVELAFPFPRIETTANDGAIISWQGKVMTVARHGLSCAYDFDTWTYAGNGCGQAVPECPGT